MPPRPKFTFKSPDAHIYGLICKFTVVARRMHMGSLRPCCIRSINLRMSEQMKINKPKGPVTVLVLLAILVQSFALATIAQRNITNNDRSDRAAGVPFTPFAPDNAGPADTKVSPDLDEMILAQAARRCGQNAASHYSTQAFNRS